MMNAMLHGIDGDIILGDALSPLGQNLPKSNVILANPPFGTKKGAGSAAGFINGFGSFGQILGVALPGYFMMWLPGVDTTVVLFYGFAAAALVAGLLLVPLWNRVPPTERA